MNIASIQALILQLARIGVGGVGVWQLVTPHGSQAVGWALIGVSGITAAVDVAKVNGQVKAAAEQATAAASRTTIIQEPAGQ